MTETENTPVKVKAQDTCTALHCLHESSSRTAALYNLWSATSRHTATPTSHTRPSPCSQCKV